MNELRKDADVIDLTHEDIAGRGAKVYRDLGVEPVVNCTGVRTQYGGSNPAPEVLEAMHAASSAFVDLDELAEAAGKRLAALTGAEWGIVTSSTTAALSLATAACIAGNDPELMLSLPRPGNIPRRVVMPAGQRFDYDHAIFAAGGDIECAKDLAHLDRLLDDSSVMLCLLARHNRGGGLTLDNIVPLARARNVPILVDAAGLSPRKPDPWLQEGADLVVYAGGKYLRGPQSTGLLLGRENLCRAAWLNGPPHQAMGRSMKIGKEEIVGALTALDRWLNSPRAALERAQWLTRIESMKVRLARVAAVSTRVLPSSASVTAPRLRIQWDPQVIPLDSETLRARLLEGKPRIMIHDFWAGLNSIVVDPVNLTDGQARCVADAICDVLTRWQPSPSAKQSQPAVDVTGNWTVRVAFLHGEATHTLRLTQEGRRITGQHFARQSTGTVTGTVEDTRISLTTRHHAHSLPYYYGFEGELSAETLSGALHLGAATDEHLGPVFQRQFGKGRWSAERAASPAVLRRPAG